MSLSELITTYQAGFAGGAACCAPTSSDLIETAVGPPVALHLSGRTRAVHVRPEDEERIRKALAAYARLWELINELTECELADLKQQVRERRRSRKRRMR